MIRTVFLACALLLTVIRAGAEPIELTAADGVRVHAELWPAPGPKPPLVVAFHQAGSSSAEYAPLAPRLVQAGFSVLAVDQRSGGDAFGGRNRTAAAFTNELAYEAALPDLEAALAWAKGRAGGAPVIVWGSSYSAALVFLLAAKHPADVAAVVAYSPAEYLDDKKAVRAAAAKVEVPVYIDQASSADEIDASAAILRAVKGKVKTQTVSKSPSVHGSATLRADANPKGAEAHWAAVLKFLARFK